ncbi:ATP-dependent RNA helicase [Entamoeba marina]
MSVGIESFTKFNPTLHQNTLQVVNEFGFTQPTKVQEKVIPAFLGRKDVIVQSQTGSGKTLSFLIPLFEIIQREQKNPQPKEVYALILAPTRELAQQIYDISLTFSKYYPYSSVLMTGGINTVKLESNINKGANVIIGTAGRVEDAIINDLFNLNWKTLEVLVLDEGDRMVEMGFAQSMTRIISHLPKQRRTGLFSATIPESLDNLIIAGCRNPYRITIEKENVTPHSLVNEYIEVPYEHRFQTLIQYLKTSTDKKIVVFVLTCDQVDFMYRSLQALPDTEKPPHTLFSIHRKVKQSFRDKVVKSFEESSQAILFCTDVVARGIDFDNIDCIVQYDPPQDPKTYVHRVGRTARMGSVGKALLFLAPFEHSFILLMEKRGVVINKITFDVPLETLNHYFNLVRQLTVEDRLLFKRSQAAFVSFCKGYGEHQCKYIFSVKKLDYANIAHGMCLALLPQTVEVKKFNVKYEELPVQVDSIPFKDSKLESKRLKRNKKGDGEVETTNKQRKRD